ncbi:MAG: DUF3775 domain-containing protein [Gammaproteobacteria bacterium]|nr:DUF3775 domain-containing protein [Gammaproteobacteria bacterium]
MIEIDRDTLQAIMDRSREFHAREDVSIPDVRMSPTDDWAVQVLADHVDNPVYNELGSIIDDLEPDQQVSLVALMWVGRGDYDASEWQDALRYAAEAHNERTAEYLIATPLLAEYLREGLDAIDALEE